MSAEQATEPTQTVEVCIYIKKKKKTKEILNASLAFVCMLVVLLLSSFIIEHCWFRVAFEMRYRFGIVCRGI